MNQEFLKREGLFLIQLVTVSLCLFGMHYYLLSHFAAKFLFAIPLWNTYLFHFVTVLLIYSIINFRFSNGKKEVFNAFILLMMLKMIMAILFLLPVILSDMANKLPDVLNFFLPYFLFLALEVYSVTNFLKEE
jgi:hypothetical protein